ncbi:alpha/beta hydrolase [Nocardioides sp. TF02-7]|uniref:alpha/beta hydrolase n=1 Tax=Nocardioides sp. TF02-7 TaxID=2917724 RepID=UPI001F056517|nr:alpha/beta hydrolase [Nocardioides sp. TF02-7]UMG91282.1 alpha/beta hydrolase [Nocardioides sp. TF02-7]
MTPTWSTRIDAAYLPVGDLPPLGLGDGNLAAVRASLDGRRAETVAATPSGAVRVEDRDLPVSGRTVAVRLYRPPGDALPVVVYAHSGGYVLGNLDTDHQRCLDLARLAGCLVVSVDYRLAPEHPYPAGLDDCFDVVAAVAADPGAVGGDGSRIALAGSSAGAGMVAALALRVRDQLPQVALRHQLLHQPMLDPRCATASMAEFGDTPYFDAASARYAWAAYAGSAVDPTYLAAALAEDVSGLPPAFVTCSEVDPLRDEAVEHALRLSRAGVPTELRLHARTCHGFDSVAPTTALSRAVVEEQAAALAAALT